MSLKRRILLAVVIGVAFALAAFGIKAYQAFHTFDVEDQIHGTFFPVVQAGEDYQRDHGSPATDLAQLIPKYISQIPSSPLVDSVKYSIMDDGKAWQLSLYSHALPKPRIYYYRSNNKFTEDEERRVLLRYHNIWTVLSE